MEYITLNTGQKIPAIGYGTWNSGKEEVGAAVACALETGYTHLDCARAYGNEEEVGSALQSKLQDGTVKREDLIIVSKLWNTYHRPDLVRKCVDESLAALGISYIDVYLMHWPVALKEDGDMLPKDEQGNFIFSDADYLDAYKAMEELVDNGLVRAIGISNFNIEQIQRILDNCRIKPAVIQVEVHPYLNQSELIEFCSSVNLPVMAYSPLGSPARPWAAKDEQILIHDAKVVAIAAKYNRTPAQILIRYALERGIGVVTKSVTPSRIRENLQVNDFKLSKEDMTTLNGMNNDFRAVPVAVWKPSKYYPFK